MASPKRVRSLLLTAAVLFMAPVPMPPSVAEDQDVFYANDFEEKDDAEFWCCGMPQVFGLEKATGEGYFVVNAKELSSDEVYSGRKALKLDLTLKDKGSKFTWASWKGPIIKVPLNKPVFLSGHVFAEGLPPDVTVGFGWSIRGSSPKGDFTQTSGIMPLVKTEHGWKHFQENVSEKIKALGWKDDAVLDHWVLFVKSKTPFNGQRLVLYLDDVKCAASLEPAPEEKTLVFSDDFARDDVGENWRAAQGGWTIKDLALYVVGPGMITCAKPVGRNVRIEYDCIAADPADLSAMVGIPIDQWYGKGYFFGFGANGNSRNKILRQGKEICTDTTHLPKANQSHHIAIEKRGRDLKMWVDGVPSLTAFDAEPLTDGEHFGLYVWGTGKFDNVKVYAVPPTTAKDEEPRALVSKYVGFEGETTGKPPTGFDAETKGSASVSVAEQPNWKDTDKGKTLVSDKCVRLDTKGDGAAEMRLRFEPIESGFIEMDVMADSYEGKPLRIAFPGKSSEELAALFVDESGTFCADQGEKPPLRFTEAPDFFPWKGMKERVYLRPKRWLTLRVGFDCKKGRFYAALLNYYALVGDGGDPNFLGHWMLLGDRIPFLRQGDAVAAASIRTADKAVVSIDNFCAYGPVHPYLVNGMDYRFPAKRLLGVTYEDRRDFPTLKDYSLRHVKPRATPCRGWESQQKVAPEFVKAGIRRSELLTRQALLDEDMQRLERVAFYLRNEGKLTPEHEALLRKVRTPAADGEAHLETDYHAFANAYMKGMDNSSLPDEGRAGEEIQNEIAAAIKDLVSIFPAKAPSLLLAAAGGSAKDYRWAKDKGYFMEGDKPAYLYPTAGWGDWHRMGEFRRILDLPGCTRTDRKAHNCKPGEYSDYEGFSKYIAPFIESRPDATFMHCLSLGPHDQWMHVPEWWVEKYGDDRDIYMQDRSGKFIAMPEGKKWYKVDEYGGPAAHLNYWNPKVKTFFLDCGRDIAKFFNTTYPGRVKVWVWGGEEIHSIYNNETGHNPSARAAFREYLKKTYKDVADLNASWGSEYKSFDEIDTPGDMDKPSGLAYEFARFRNDGYCEMVETIKRGLNEGSPDVPLSGYLNIPFGGMDRKTGFDLVKMLETFDIFTYHTYRTGDWQPMNRCLDSLRKAFPRTGLGVLEWGAAMVSNPQLYDEECYKANGLAMLFDSMAWGQCLHDLWRGTGTGAAAGDNWPEPRLDNLVLRYSTTHMPVTMARIRKLGRPALEQPTVQPDAAILEVTSSFYNALPTNLYYLGVRHWMGRISIALEENGWNYGFLYEQLLLDGRQKVDGIRTIIVPAGFCCPPELADMLLAWTKKGGTLILVGPCGIYDRYGKPDNRLLRAAFGDTGWAQKTSRSWQPDKETPALKPGEDGVYEAALGAGKIVLFSDLDDPFPMDSVTKSVADRTRRTIACSNPDFEWVLRESPEAYYLYIVNTNARPLDGPGEAEVALAKPIKAAADLGITPPVSVPLKTEKGITRFSIRLAQGGGTLVWLEK